MYDFSGELVFFLNFVAPFVFQVKFGNSTINESSVMSRQKVRSPKSVTTSKSYAQQKAFAGRDRSPRLLRLTVGQYES